MDFGFEGARFREVLLLHAAHHQAEGFEDITWGLPQAGRFGRASKALYYLSSHHNAFLYVGCGALAPDAPVLSRLVYEMMLERGAQVPGFESYSRADLEAFLAGRCYLDEVAQTTVEEIANAAKFCRWPGVKQLTLLSSPTHLPRCLRDALVLREQEGGMFRREVEIGVCASDTNFARSRSADVVVFEPPHRMDRHQVPVHLAVTKLFRRLGTQADAERLERLLIAIGDDGRYAKLLEAIGEPSAASN